MSYSGPTLPTSISATLAPASSSETAIFANGCFWGTQHIFDKHFKGKLIQTEVGYVGGHTENPSYRQVCTGATNHAEALKVVFDPSKITYAELAEFHFRMHDPTQENGQGPDRGTQYRSAIFTTTPEQMEVANKIKAEVQEKYYANKKIATKIEEAGKWWTAEQYHQEYLNKNPGGYECPSHRLYW